MNVKDNNHIQQEDEDWETEDDLPESFSQFRGHYSIGIMGAAHGKVENLVERYTIKNLYRQDVFVEHGNFGIGIHPDDQYTTAVECMTQKCQSQIWCGYNTSYINSLKMGESNINLGLILTKGSLQDYSILGSKKNNRGEIVLNAEHFELLPDQEYVIEWEMFWHSGNAEFYDIASKYNSFVGINAEQYTVFKGEDIKFTVSVPGETSNIKIISNDKEIPYAINGKEVTVEYKHNGCGEYRFDVYADDVHTYCEFFVSEELDKLIENRVNFLIDKQQYHKENSVVDGAYLIYDNEEKCHRFNGMYGGHNACTERICMAMLIAKYAQKTGSKKAIKSLERFLICANKEFFDEDTGMVYGHFGKENRGEIRLYNSPWFALFQAELYFLKKDKKYLYNICKILDLYYEKGGYRFYPNGFSLIRILDAFEDAGLLIERNEILEKFKTHVDNIVEINDNYPIHEVNYEQTIVGPAVSYISELSIILNDNYYAHKAKPHVIRLSRFNGHQPSFRLHEMPIRFWDLFYGGKCRMYGDNFPQYWDCLTAKSFHEYYRASGDEIYKKAATICLRNCLSLYKPDGEASCGYMYPFMANGKPGKFYDGYANDQDFILYYAMSCKILE